jgi:gas vesicle protein
MREIVGFVMGAAAGAAGALFATSTEGRALLERLKDEARPETERAATEWEPVLREVSRAVRLAVRELETATVDLRARIGEIATEGPDNKVDLAMAEPALEPGVAGPAGAVPAVEAAETALDVEAPEPLVEATVAPATAAADPAEPADDASPPAPTT